MLSRTRQRRSDEGTADYKQVHTLHFLDFCCTKMQQKQVRLLEPDFSNTDPLDKKGRRTARATVGRASRTHGLLLHVLGSLANWRIQVNVCIYVYAFIHANRI